MGTCISMEIYFWIYMTNTYNESSRIAQPTNLHNFTSPSPLTYTHDGTHWIAVHAYFISFYMAVPTCLVFKKIFLILNLLE